MSERTAAISSALTALEQALSAVVPPLEITEQPLDSVDLTPTPIAPAGGFEGVEEALDPLIGQLGEALGDL